MELHQCRPSVLGMWKMQGTLIAIATLERDFHPFCHTGPGTGRCYVAFCPSTGLPTMHCMG